MTKNIIITGSSSGIGFGLCKYYLKNGHNVIGISRKENAELIEYNNFTHYCFDLTNGTNIKTCIEDISSYTPQIDLLILNAGILGEIKRMENQSLDQAKEVLEINLWANKNFMDELILQKASVKQIVAISSGASKNGSGGWGPYSISKAALNMLIQTYATENPNIHFSSIAPGLVDTAMQDYIYSLKDVEEFPVLARLQSAKGTEHMPDAITLAPKLDLLFQKVLKSKESGCFVDIREVKN